MKPILFSAPMVRAILDGRKSMTRRVIKPPKWSTGYYDDFELNGTEVQAICDDTGCFAKINPSYSIGDILWVRETWTYLGTDGENNPCFGYRATSPHLQDNMYVKWRPSIFMPKEASRIFLRVISIRAERLQDISEEDARSEGLVIRYRFINLWDELNSKRGYGWDLNPFVWVYGFEQISKEEAYKEEKA